MIHPDLVTLLSQFLGRDIAPDLTALGKTKDVLYVALPKDKQVFISAELHNLWQFFMTEEGKVAINTLVGDWEAYVKRTKEKAP